MPRKLPLIFLVGCTGCVSGVDMRPSPTQHESVQVASSSSNASLAQHASLSHEALIESSGPANAESNGSDFEVQQVSGFEPVVIDDAPSISDKIPPSSAMANEPVVDGANDPVVTGEPEASFEATNAVQVNLPTALSMVGGQHPAVGFARWRVQEAYAQLDQARVLWLPTIQAGFSFHRHDGNYQASNGEIIDVNRNSFQYGLGAGATGAGTTQRPGLVAEFQLADAIFQPRIAKTTAWARGHAANAIVNTQLRDAALAYLDLTDAYQDERILDDSASRTSELAKLTADFAQAGEGLQADADRLATESKLMESRMIAAAERMETSSAQLARVLSVDAAVRWMPMDINVVPLTLVAAETDSSELISMALATRPELKESQALVAAACEAYQRQKVGPFVPSVVLGFSNGGFGGGLGDNLDNVDSRYDFDAMMLWQVRNLGYGEQAARRESVARVQQAKFQQLQVLDQIASEVAQSHAQVRYRGQQIEVTREAIATAENSVERNLSRIRDGQGLPIEALQSIQALETARRAYLRSVVDYNAAQFRLQHALGWPVQAPTESP